VDSATGLSYQVGAGTMLEGMDEAVTGLSVDEDAIFDTTLVGGDHAGESAQVKVVVKSVKERELPEANDDFAQLASEFDTLAELREDLAKQAADSKVVEQGVEARDKVLDKLVELVEVPVPESVVEEQLEQHFKAENSHGEGEHDTEEHRAEVKANTARAFQNEIILDAIAEKEEVGVSQNELIDYIVTTASQYGMDPNQFAQIIDQSGQVPMMVSEVRRRKALAVVLGQAEVTDSEGNKVDLSDFVRPGGEEAPAVEAEAETEAEEAAGETVANDDPAAVKF
jgi:trigger factor